MKAATEELLYFLLWGVDRFCRPTFRNLTDSFEEWASRQGLQRRLWELERQHLLERIGETSEPPRYQLTERGLTRALGGRNPVAAWNRPWDGHWRMVVFDLPESKASTRARLRRFLRGHGFGYLQNSVWISPHPLDRVMEPWIARGHDVESLITFEAKTCSGESDAAVVAGAWSFDRINALYSRCFAILAQAPGKQVLRRESTGALRRWAKAEREAWFAAVSSDPLLPRALLPVDYLGERVWRERQQCLGTAARLFKA